MLDAKCNGMSRYLLAAAILCGIPYVYPATKGQRVLSSPDIPVTQFTCTDRPPGYYADLETGCQVYHMCTEGSNQFSYRCPNTTLFQQRMLICAHWYQVNCSRSEQHYGANLLIGQRDKPFVDDLVYSSQGKQVKTLQNPDTLQNIGHSSKEGSDSQMKLKARNENAQTNRVFQNNFKRDGESSFGFAGKTTPFASSYPSTAFPTRTPGDLSSLPLAGSVLPGGLKSLQHAHPPDRTTQFFKSAVTSQQSSTNRGQFGFSSSTPTQRGYQPVPFTSTTTPKPIEKVHFVASTKSPVAFSTQVAGNFNTSQPSAFNIQQPFRNVFQQGISKSEPSEDVQPPSDQKQDLTAASQENAFSSRLSTTPPPSVEIGENLPETDVKAIIEPTNNGSIPDDKFNTFINRFNPYEETPLPESEAKPDQAEPEYHTFINRFVPSFGPSAPESGAKEQPGDHVFINRFVLTPEELKREKDRENVNKLHDLQPPEERLTVNFPNFDLSPPFDDSDDSESNTIELHLQDSRRNLFIPDDADDEFSKADAAPIVISIPLHTLQKSPPMWFKTEKSNDPCARCHPAFLIKKDTCMPCVIIR